MSNTIVTSRHFDNYLTLATKIFQFPWWLRLLCSVIFTFFDCQVPLATNVTAFSIFTAYSPLLLICIFLSIEGPVGNDPVAIFLTKVGHF